MSTLSGEITIVVGASGGIGRGIATAFADAGARVVAVSRTAALLPRPASGAGTIQPEIADAGHPTVPASLLERYDPNVVISGSRRAPAHAAAAAADMGNVLRQLACRCADHVPLAAGNPAQAPAARQPGRCRQQRRGARRVAAERRLRRRQGHPALYDGVRAARQSALVSTSRSLRCCRDSHPRRASASRRSRRTPLVPACRWRSTSSRSSNGQALWSPRRLPALLSCSWRRKMPARLPPPTC